jgi:hypothetical protein
MPRSGIWMVRCKSDRRWNLRGQYFSSEWWDPPASSWPPEAIDALDQHRASLGSSPPEDLSCVYLPYPRGKLKRLFSASVLIATERQGALHCLTEESGLTILGLDREKGEVWFGKPGHEPAHRFRAQALGTLDQDNSLWHWAWVAEATGALNRGVLNSAKAMHEYGTKHKVPELTYEQIALGVEDDRPWFNAGYLSKIACHLCDADFVIAGGSSEQPSFKEFWLINAPGVLPQPESVSRRIFFVIREALNTWGPDLGGSPARKAVEAYAKQRNCAVSDWTGQEIEWATHEQGPGEIRLRIDDVSGGSMYVDFDKSGDITAFECPPPQGQQPAKQSWLKRFFGRSDELAYRSVAACIAAIRRHFHS